MADNIIIRFPLMWRACRSKNVGERYKLWQVLEGFVLNQYTRTTFIKVGLLRLKHTLSNAHFPISHLINFRTTAMALVTYCMRTGEATQSNWHRQNWQEPWSMNDAVRNQRPSCYNFSCTSTSGGKTADNECVLQNGSTIDHITIIP